MEKSDKQEILDAIRLFATQVTKRMDGMEEHMSGIEKRMDGMEGRMSGTEERIGSLAQEMRSGFESVDRRLVSLEDKVDGIEKSLDEILEGDVLGKQHITLTRPEYDSIVDSLHLPNRFAA